jgi:type III pantothenate kinase
MHIAIDSGNTSIKAGLFDSMDCLQVFRFEDEDQFKQTWESDWKGLRKIISNVGAREIAIDNTCLLLTPQTPIPIRTEYTTPHTLGMDRIAALCGTWQLFPHSDTLVVDAGTCLTMDILTSEGVHKGGLISPGWAMRMKAMHIFTGKLPELTPAEIDKFVGMSTSECMQLGAYFGIRAEFNQYCSIFLEKYPSGKVLITGGDSKIFETPSQSIIFAVRDLVLIGLSSILLYNESIGKD